MKVFWKDAEKTILIREAPETWLWEDYESNVHKMHTMLHAINHDVFIVIDARRVQSVPKDSLSHFSHANENMPSHVVARILVTQNTLMVSLKSAAQKIVPENFENFYFADSMEEAYEKIAQEQAKRQKT